MNSAAYPRVSRLREKRTFQLFGLNRCLAVSTHAPFVELERTTKYNCARGAERHAALKDERNEKWKGSRCENILWKKDPDQDAFDDIIVELKPQRNWKSNYCQSTAQIKPLLAQLIQNPTKQTNNCRLVRCATLCNPFLLSHWIG